MCFTHVQKEILHFSPKTLLCKIHPQWGTHTHTQKKRILKLNLMTL